MTVFALLLLAAITTPDQAEDAAHRADRLRTQQLNREAGAYVAARDRRSGAYERDYRDARARYERQLAEWRARVGACEAGDYRAC